MKLKHASPSARHCTSRHLLIRSTQSAKSYAGSLNGSCRRGLQLEINSSCAHREKEEDQRKKDDIDNNVVTLSGRLDIVDQLLGGMSKAASSGEALSVEVARVDRRVQLLEDELGHVKCMSFTSPNYSQG